MPRYFNSIYYTNDRGKWNDPRLDDYPSFPQTNYDQGDYPEPVRGNAYQKDYGYGDYRGSGFPYEGPDSFANQSSPNSGRRRPELPLYHGAQGRFGSKHQHGISHYATDERRERPETRNSNRRQNRIPGEQHNFGEEVVQHGQYDEGRYDTPYGKSGMNFRGVGPKAPKRSDERMHEELCERLTQDEEIDASDLDVEVKNGIVVLTGSVPNRWMKYLAEEVAENVAGICEVENKLKVKREAQQ